MATQFDPIAKDESLNTTEVTPRNIADVIAEGLKGIEDALPTYTEGDGIDISAQKVISVDTTFTEASTRANIASGDSLSTIWGKIKKFFTDLKAVAFSGAAADVTYDNGTVKDALDGLKNSKKWRFILTTALSPASTTYNFPFSIADYDEVIVAGNWANGNNSVWVHIPIFGGEVNLAATYLMLNNSPTNTHYAKVTAMTTTSITAEATDTTTWIRVYVR